MLKEANCIMIAIGIESGDEEVRTKVLQRRMKDQRIIEAFEIVQKHGIAVSSFNMVGIPGETKGLFQKTISLNARIKPDIVQQTIFYPYRGTGLGELAYREGYVVREGYPTYLGRGTLSLPGFSLQEIERTALFFEYNVYKHIDRKRAIRGLARAMARRYPRFCNGAKKVLTMLNIRHYGWRYSKGVSVMGSDSKISTRPTAGVSEGIVQGVCHASGT